MSTPEFTKKVVKSSNGSTEYHYQAKLTFHLYGKKYKTKFNLSNRYNMQFSVLLSRKFSANKFLVDLGKKNLSKKN
ncbi:MAG: hypothetical protein COA58_08155 [Bacteroidetes bacterium]|nr:MAG: hypothetical protein COA58_08155 [Bacteroidota bacterium]